MHTLEHAASTVSYPEGGSDIVVKVVFKNNRVYINDTQYFDDVPQSAWDFLVGGYQPAQKWLKDRKNRQLTSDELEHYPKLIASLLETARLMQAIDSVILNAGGFPLT